MPHPQSRDIGGRNEGRNGATPVFDPAMSPGSTDAEAGGGPASIPAEVQEPPARHASEGGSLGVRLTPRFWYAAAAAVVVILIAAAVLS